MLYKPFIEQLLSVHLQLMFIDSFIWLITVVFIKKHYLDVMNVFVTSIFSSFKI